MIILDTSFIVSYYNTRDENHSKAVEIMRDLESGRSGSLLITDYIFDESITVILVRLKNLSKTVKIGTDIWNSTKMLRIEIDDFEKAWEIFKNQKETSFSFTDCTIIVLMKKENIENIVTFDEDFKKIVGINVVS